MATQPLPCRGPRSGEKAMWIHNLALLEGMGREGIIMAT